MSSLVLYARQGCHLCDLMQEEIAPLLHEFACDMRVEDVDARQEWQRSYGNLLPVLTTADGEMLCYYHLDEQKLRDWLQQQAANLCSD